VSNFCLVMGVAGAGAINHTVLITASRPGCGRCSMALGEWLSVANARELARTRSPLKPKNSNSPCGEQNELALILQAKGLRKEDANARSADHEGQAWRARYSGARGAGHRPRAARRQPMASRGGILCPILSGRHFPGCALLLDAGTLGTRASAAASAVALRRWDADIAVQRSCSWFSVLRQLAFGGLAAGVTYTVGVALGTSLV